MMDADAALEDLFQFRPGAVRPVVSSQLVGELRLLAVGEQRFTFELFGDVPALVAIEAKDECGRVAALLRAGRHDFNLFVEQLVADPLILKRHLALGALNKFNVALMRETQPLRELVGVAHGGGEQ